MARRIVSGLRGGAAAIALLGALSGRAGGEPRGSLGLEWSSFSYREPGLMREDGSMLGLRACASADADPVELRFRTAFSWGTLTYDGAVQTATGERDPIRLDTPNRVFTLEVESGFPMDSTAGAAWTPFVGLGFRYLVNDLASSQQGGYLREQVYWYAPVGVEAAWTFSEGWRAGGRAEYDIFISGRNQSGGSTFTQSRGWGYQLAAFVEFAPGQGGWTLRIEPFLRSWDVAESSFSLAGYDEQGRPVGFLEPANTTTDYGLRVLVQL